MNRCKQVNVIMPMLGRGERMQKCQNTCKPLMKLPDGELFFLKALSSLRNYKIHELVLVVLEEYFEDFIKISKRQIEKHVGRFDCLIIVASKPTENPVQTLKVGLSALEDIHNPLISLDCDIYASLPFVNIDEDYFGYLYSFEDNVGDKSYVKCNEFQEAISIAEKQMISTDAIFGAYVFSNGENVNTILGKNERLKYISDIYALVLSNNKVFVNKLDKVMNFGTLEEFNKL